MKHTVRQLAKVSGVSVRTLHWYDEIGLLKPAYYHINGYRYYEAGQLLQLQKILFFRELGFKLNDVQKLIAESDAEKIKALSLHKMALEKNVGRTKKIINTIDKTILHLQGDKDVSDQEFYSAIIHDNQKAHDEHPEKYYGEMAAELVGEGQKKMARWSPEEWNIIQRDGNDIYRALVECKTHDLEPGSDEAQALIHKHYQMMKRLYTVSKDVYLGLAQLYREHKGFCKFFDSHHPELVDFLAEGMRVYAERNLS